MIRHEFTNFNPLDAINRNLKFQEKPHRNIENKSFRDQLLVHIAMICYAKVKWLDDFDKNYVSMWLKNKN